MVEGTSQVDGRRNLTGGRENLTTKVKCLSRETKLYVDCMIVNFCLRWGQGQGQERGRGWMAYTPHLSVSSVQNL